jgi:hypothetical protein
MGPTWIWSHLDFSNCDEEECVIDTHVMNTPLDHPVLFAGGKLYGKVLSPARVLDWIHTDSLRRQAQPVNSQSTDGSINDKQQYIQAINGLQD